MYPNNLRDLRFPRPHHTITLRIGPSPLGAKDLQGAEWEVIQGHRVENLPELAQEWPRRVARLLRVL